MPAYATVVELEQFLLKPSPKQATRLLERASTLVAWYIRVPVTVDAQGQPTEYKTVIRDAVCAQVEYWMSAGEQADIVRWSGQEGEQAQPPLGPRTARILLNAGLIPGAVSASW